LHIETEREDDGRWIAAVPELRGVMVHGKSQEMRSGRFVHWRFV
jgi:predicted RNase H-like HicB family nuclease